MLTKIKPLLNQYMFFLIKALAQIGVTPNLLTISSLLLASLLFVTTFILGGSTPPILVASLFGVSGLFDFLDGGLARYTGKTSKVGAFLDSTVDRINEALFIASFAYCGMINFQEAYLIIVGSLLVSYTRARAEGLKHNVKLEGVGLMERAERLVILIIIYILYVSGFALLSKIVFYLLVVAVYLTVVHRIMAIITFFGKKH